MKVKGSHALDADKMTIWAMLIDPDVLTKITPGVSKLERIEGDKFIAISDVKIGPVRGTFKGNMELKDRVENEKMIVVLDQKSMMGNAIAEIGMTLISLDDGKTEIKYEGEAKLSGKLASMGQRILGGVVSSLSKEFFKELEKELRKDEVVVEEKEKLSILEKIVQFFKNLFK